VKAREVSCLGLVVAAIAAATLFAHGLNNETQELVSSEAEIVTTDVIKTKLIADRHVNTKQKKHRPLSQNSIEVEFENREEVIENLQSKFRLLETQYGILSIDDIAQLEASLSGINELDALINLNSALDELLIQP